MNDRELTILSVAQIKNLDVLEKYGKAATITDLCILTGGLVDNNKFINEDRSLKGRTGFFWTSTKSSNKETYDIFGNGFIMSSPSDWRCRSIRPVLTSPTVFSATYPYRIKGYNGTEEVEYGEYPQDAASIRMQKKLELEYCNNGMKKTGRSYTFDSVKSTDYNTEFTPIIYDEYEYKGKKYIRIIANTSYGNCQVKLSNGNEYKTADSVWIEVSPVKWLIDEQAKILLSKKGLVSGIRSIDKKTKYGNDFNNTEIKKYLDKYMLQDLTQSEKYNPIQFDLLVEKNKIEDQHKKTKKEQINKLMQAKQKLKEAAELLNSPLEDIKINKIKIDNLRSIVLKNNGNPTKEGYREFNDFFKDNGILRLIDLKDLDLDNVNIRNMDFSGTNIHIDPQTIYNKDMTGVNALDVHFSPFLDSFNDVILDGALINDHEAMIDFDKLKSYDENTVVESKLISKGTK